MFELLKSAISIGGILNPSLMSIESIELSNNYFCVASRKVICIVFEYFKVHQKQVLV